MRLTILTLFPQWFAGVFGESILARAQESGIVTVGVRNLRDWAKGPHLQVDDAPYGGGGGMLFKAEPVAAALDELAGAPGSEGRAKVIYTSPRGQTWNQSMAKDFAAGRRDLVILCGHYEGLDERIIQTRVDEEISIGDFVMTGGEIAAMAMVDSIVRLLPGALHHADSATNDSFYNGLLEGPHYTRPEVFEGIKVPDILLSGHHKKIIEWRHEQALEITKSRRPELHAKWLADNPPPPPKKRRKKKPPGSAGPPTGHGGEE